MCDSTHSPPCFESVVFCSHLQYIIPSLLSAISTAIVLIVSISGKFWRRPLSIMIFAINAADFLYFMVKLSVLVRNPDSDMTCMVMQAINVFGITLSASWAALFGHAFYEILKNKNDDVISSLLKYYIPTSFVLPVATGLGTFLTDNIRVRETGMCVYRVYIGVFDLFVFFHLQLPVTLAIVLCILFYILSISELRHIIIKGKVRESLTLMIYPAILILCWGPIIGMQIAAELGVSISDPVARTIRIISHLMGLLDALIYGEGIKGTFRGCLKACKKKNSVNLSTSFFESPEQTITDSLIKTQIHLSSEELQDLRCTKVILDFSENFNPHSPSMSSSSMNL